MTLSIAKRGIAIITTRIKISEDYSYNLILDTILAGDYPRGNRGAIMLKHFGN